MGKTLQRLLRIRVLKEEISRAELARENQLLGEMERSLKTLREQEHISAMAVSRRIVEDQPPDLLGETVRRLATSKSEQLAVLAPVQRASAAAAMSSFLECYRLKMQIETLVNREDAQARYERDRSMQAEMDEWATRRHYQGQKDQK